MSSDGLQRDRPETAFSRIMQQFLLAQRGVLAVVFVDSDGECIDYASRITPMDALVFGATLLPLTVDLGRRLQPGAAGALVLWLLETTKYDFVVRAVTDEHVVVVVLESRGIGANLLRAMAGLADELRREADLCAPCWDPAGEPCEVTTRPAAGWGYAPSTIRLRDRAQRVLEVLGRWTERSAVSSHDLVCFRVRCEDVELTLAHDLVLGRWYPKRGG